MVKAAGCLELPVGTHIDMVVDIIYHGASGPLYDPQSVDHTEKTWKQSEYEKLTQKGEKESRALGQATAECLKDLGMPDKLAPHDVEFRSTDVLRNIKTAREFMEGFSQEYKSLKISDIQDIPGLAPKASSKEVALKVMPQSGNNRTRGSGDCLLQSAPTPWHVPISYPDYDEDEKDPDEETTPLPEK